MRASSAIFAFRPRQSSASSSSCYLVHPIDLSDARTSFGLSLFTVDSKVALVDAIDQFVKMIDCSVSEKASEFVAKAKAEALAEWEKFEFYNRPYRSYSARRLMQIAQPSDRRAALSTESNADRLRLQHTTIEGPSPEREGIRSTAQPAEAIAQRTQSRQQSKRSIRKRKPNGPFNRKGKPPTSKTPAP